MRLCDILDCFSDVEVKGLAEDSRLVKDGYVFFATKGYNVDHFDYIDDAVKKGAVAIVCDRKANFDNCIIVNDVRKCLIKACEKFYGVSTKDFNFIGITGTDGKTTVATIISRLIDGGYIGTNGLEYGDISINTSNTTPTICELFKCLKTLNRKKCKNVVMEVSSEALIHHRVDHIKYDVVCYTNITEDHLNIHKNINNYVAAKRKLLNLVDVDGLVFVNSDDDNCSKIKGDNVYSYGFNPNSNYVISNVNKMSKNVCFDIFNKDSIFNITSPFTEKFNIYNVALAFIVCKEIGYNVECLMNNIRKLKSINGRCEKLYFGQKYDIVLDYAHTYNAIKNIVNAYKDKRKIVVTGAAGGREEEKRCKIGKFLIDNCDMVIFTMDDPRFEDVNDIINQMIGDYKYKSNYLRIVDRKEAIYKAFEIADSYDTLLILGKGSDNYMAIKDKKEDYCDYNVICDYFS